MYIEMKKINGKIKSSTNSQLNKSNNEHQF
jgi:hypothetical protein